MYKILIKSSSAYVLQPINDLFLNKCRIPFTYHLKYHMHHNSVQKSHLLFLCLCTLHLDLFQASLFQRLIIYNYASSFQKLMKIEILAYQFLPHLITTSNAPQNWN